MLKNSGLKAHNLHEKLAKAGRSQVLVGWFTPTLYWLEISSKFLEFVKIFYEVQDLPVGRPFLFFFFLMDTLEKFPEAA